MAQPSTISSCVSSTRSTTVPRCRCSCRISVPRTVASRYRNVHSSQTLCACSCTTMTGAEQFFIRMLAGSEVTSMINPASKKSANVMNTVIMEAIPFVAFRNHGITAATMIKVAWTLVLANLAATSDVVYGYTVSGRNLPLEGVESVIGPCLNVLPVRANMNNTNTILDLL